MSDAVANTGSAAWYVIESNKPSLSLASNACNAVPAGVVDPAGTLTDAQGPNNVVWRLKMENAFGLDVVDIAFDLRWEYGARQHGGGAFIPNCYLYVPHCSVLWGHTVEASLHVQQPDNVGSGRAPMARLPLTISGTISTPVNVHGIRWDFQLFGDGSYHVS